MSCIILKGIIDEDFVNYRVPSMTLMFPYCSFKCNKELCQNSSLAKEHNIEIEVDKICIRYINNPISEAIVCQGLEPLDSFEDLVLFIHCLRYKYNNYDPIVIYTGYNKDEILDKIDTLMGYENIVMKYGRYVSGQKSHWDSVLGVNLISDNQWAEILTPPYKHDNIKSEDET